MTLLSHTLRLGWMMTASSQLCVCAYHWSGWTTMEHRASFTYPLRRGLKQRGLKKRGLKKRGDSKRGDTVRLLENLFLFTFFHTQQTVCVRVFGGDVEGWWRWWWCVGGGVLSCQHEEEHEAGARSAARVCWERRGPSAGASNYTSSEMMSRWLWRERESVLSRVVESADEIACGLSGDVCMSVRACICRASPD